MDELWKPITGYEDLYEVSNLGRVRSLDMVLKHWKGGTILRKGRILKLKTTCWGYLEVCLSKDNHNAYLAVHRLVGLHFLPLCLDANHVNHKDFDRKNNVVTNLEWTTRKGNAQHATLGGKYSPITNPNMARKLTLEQVVAIRAARTLGLTYKAIGKRFGVNPSTAHRIVTLETWNP
jgi:hypothetical protein